MPGVRELTFKNPQWYLVEKIADAHEGQAQHNLHSTPVLKFPTALLPLSIDGLLISSNLHSQKSCMRHGEPIVQGIDCSHLKSCMKLCPVPSVDSP